MKNDNSGYAESQFEDERKRLQKIVRNQRKEIKKAYAKNRELNERIDVYKTALNSFSELSKYLTFLQGEEYRTNDQSVIYWPEYSNPEDVLRITCDTD